MGTRDSKTPDNWEARILGNDVDIRGRIGWRGYKKTDLRNSGPVVIGGVNLKSQLYLDMSDIKYISREKYIESPEIQLQEGDVLVVQRGNGLGDTGYFDGSIKEATINPTIIVLRNFRGDPRFLFYYLTSPQGQNAILAMASGSSIPALYQNHLKKLRYPQPPLHEQRQIAHILGTLDDKIELNRKMNRTLEAMAQALFKSWFVDFDPVIDNALRAGNPIPPELEERAAIRSGILNGNLPEFDTEDDASEIRLPSPSGRGAGGEGAPHSLFPDAFQNSEMGPIPEGWEVKALDEIADFLNGTACQKYPAEPGQDSLPVIKIRELRQGITDNTDRANTHIASKYVVNDGDVLFSWSGSLLVKIWTDGTGFLNQHVFKATSDNFPKWFFFKWIQHHLHEFQRIAADKATTMGHIKRHHLSEAMTIVPSDDLLNRMTIRMSLLHNKHLENELQAKKLTKVRDLLLPELISGALRTSK